MYPSFPVGENKIPLIKGWKEAATKDPKQHELWKQLFKDRIRYWGIPTGERTDLLVLDVDVKDGRNGFDTLKAKGLTVPPTMSQRTQSGGYHYFFRYPKDGRVYGNRSNLFGSATLKTGLDIRGEGGFVCYYGINFRETTVEAPLWLLEDAGKPAYEAQGPIVKIDPGIAEIMINTSLEALRNATEGERNHVLNVESFKIGQVVASGSITREYAEITLLNAALTLNLPVNEAKSTIASGLNGGAKKPLTSPFESAQPQAQFPFPQKPDARWTPRKITREDLMNVSKLRKPQLFQDWSTEDIMLTTADGGAGKTTLTLNEAVCMALNEPFLGFPCKRPGGKTLFVTGEDTAEKLMAMLGEMMKQMGVYQDPEKVNLIIDRILIKKDIDLCLVSKDKIGHITPNQEALRRLNEAIEDFGPDMIVFDPISTFWGRESDLNDMARAVTKFMTHLVDQGIAVNMINHMGKVSSGNKDISQFAGRGGTGLPSHSRVVRVIHPISDIQYQEETGDTLGEKETAMMCAVSKFSDGSPLLNKPFVIKREKYLFSRKSLKPEAEKEAEKRLSDNERVFTFIKNERLADRYPTRKVVIGYFATHNEPLSKARVEHALNLIQYSGHLGEFIKLTTGPDLTQKDEVYVVTNTSGDEL